MTNLTFSDLPEGAPKCDANLTMRLPKSLVARLDKLAKSTRQTRNRLMYIILDMSVKEIEASQKVSPVTEAGVAESSSTAPAVASQSVSPPPIARRRLGHGRKK